MDTNSGLHKLYRIGIIVFCIIGLLIAIIYGETIYKHKNTSHLRAENAVIDLASLSDKETKYILLAGKWEFYYKKFLDPMSDISITHDGYIDAPGIWNSFIYKGRKIGSDAYATYRLNVTGLDPDETYAIEIPDISSAYRLYIDGKLISQNGIPGTDAKEEKPLWKPSIHFFSPKHDITEIIIHASNFHHIEGGMWEGINIGKPQYILFNNNFDIFRSFFLIGSILLLGLYHTGLHVFMKNSRAGLYLGLFCINIALREFVTGSTILPIHLFFPDMPFDITVRLEYITVPLSAIFYGNYVSVLFGEVSNKKMYSIINLLNSVYVVIILFFPFKAVSSLLWYCKLMIFVTALYILYIYILAIKNRIYGSELVVISTVMLITVAYLDFFVGELSYVSGIGVLFFLLTQSYLIALKIRYAFEESQRKSAIEISFLQAQIIPHFFYNILNTIDYFIGENPAKAKEILLELGNYLRGKFRINQYDQIRLITLEEEVNMIHSYLKLQKARLCNELNIDIDLDRESLKIKIPPFILQPIVENAVIHGIRNMENPKITIRSRITDKHLYISIQDNGKGIDRDKLSKISTGANMTSIGLKNISDRLKNHYKSKLEFTSKEGEGTVVSIKIPI